MIFNSRLLINLAGCQETVRAKKAMSSSHHTFLCRLRGPPRAAVEHLLSVLFGAHRNDTVTNWKLVANVGKWPLGGGDDPGTSSPMPALSKLPSARQGGEQRLAAGCSCPFRAGGDLCVFSLGNCVKISYPSCNTCFTQALVLSDTIWNNICHPLSGVIYLLACREPSAAPRLQRAGQSSSATAAERRGVGGGCPVCGGGSLAGRHRQI